MQPKDDWRTYERHPISARYPDIKGQAFEDFCENMSKRKIRGRTITLHEGKILDGWQLYRACLELNVEPRFTVLREGEDPEAFVEEANEHRRHESVETMCERAAKRRERVAAMRQAGSSIPAIADAVGKSIATVQRDLAAPGLSPDKPGKVPEPPSGKTTGQDGKQYPAKKPKILCAHCQTLARKGLALPQRCEECSALNRKPQAGQTRRAPRGLRNGQLLRNFKKEFDAAYGTAVRIIDDMRRELGCAETGPFRGALHSESALLQNFNEAWAMILKKRKS